MQKIQVNKTVEFKPKGLFKNGHFQTIYSSVFFNLPNLNNSKILQIKVNEEATLECEYNQAINSQKKACIILVHGLEGSAKSNFIVSTATKLLNKGFDVLRMNMRNCGNTFHLSKTLYNAGLSGDVKELIIYCQKELGHNNIFIAGFSLGANTVLKLAGETNQHDLSVLKGVVAVSPPLDLLECSLEVIKPKNKIYDNYYLKRLKKTYQTKKKYTPDLIDTSLLKKIKNMYDFDDLITAPSFGYKDAKDYYYNNSSLDFIENIKVKTLIIQAKDDPIIPFASTERALKINNPHIKYLVTDSGGHVGFLNSRKLAKDDLDIHWAENRIVEFVENFF